MDVRFVNIPYTDKIIYYDQIIIAHSSIEVFDQGIIIFKFS